jgi:hypothetical protein
VNTLHFILSEDSTANTVGTAFSSGGKSPAISRKISKKTQDVY